MPSAGERIDIVITSFNRIEFTKKTIDYIKDRTKSPYRIIVVDNCSTDGTQDYLVSLKRDKVIGHLILLEENYGIHMAKNYGLSLVRSEPYYIDTDNDLLCPKLEPDWIEQLKGLMDRNPEYGAIACTPQALIGSGKGGFEEGPEVIKMGHVGAHLRMMRTKAVRDVGGWERKWDAKRNSEDGWIATQLGKLNLDVGYARDIHCWHQFGDDNNWGYKDMPIKQHGHREMWPPTNHYESIKSMFDPITWKEIKEK